MNKTASVGQKMSLRIGVHNPYIPIDCLATQTNTLTNTSYLVTI
jgi:hypothetical protein